MTGPNRRTVLRAASAAGLALLAACSRTGAAAPTVATPPPPDSTGTPGPTGPAPTGSTAAGPPPGSGGPAAEVVRGPADSPHVALTFHGAGDPALANRLLDEVQAAGAYVTVFAVGTWLDGQPDFARRLVDGGHELANHTYTHPALRRLGAAATLAEVTRCRDVLVQRSGSAGRFFRPSGTPRATPRILAAAGEAGYRTSLAYDIDPEDYRDPGADAVRRRVLAATRPGSVVSLHLGHAGTVMALPAILSGLAGQGLAAVTASTLLGP